MKDFVHLHLHTQYSLLDGAIIIDRLMEKAKTLGMKAIAITDHGQMFGMISFYNACKYNGIKPIIGFEAYISPTKRSDKTFARGDTSNYHLILLAKNNTGLANLMKLTSIAYLEGMYYRPRIDKEVLAAHSEGVIAMSACLGGEIAQKILNQSYEAAKEAALEYDQMLGRGNYYLELQQNGIPEQDIVNPMLVKISEETGIPLVATCDCHYLDKGDDESHTVLMCIQTKTFIDNPDRMETASKELYFKSQEEMAEAFKDFPPEAIENTVKIADMCNVTIKSGQDVGNRLPVFEVPDGYDQNSYFAELTIKGLTERLKNIPESEHQTYKDRLDYEIKIITDKTYAGYFLIVWDFINFARENGIPVGPGRGSGAGSLAAYSLRITDIDPIKMRLMFERFLNPERPSLPDFDVDFCVRRRDEVINYVKQKYGEEKTAKILTLGELSGKSALNDVGRVLRIPLPVTRKLSKLIPDKDADGGKVTLAKTLEDSPDVGREIKLALSDKKNMPATVLEICPNIGEALLTHTLKLEGLFRNSGVHAAGIAIADKPITEYVPLCKLGDEVVIQLEMSDLEKAGIVKFDFLGLANLTVINDATERIRKELDPNFDIKDIVYDDKEVYEMLARGETVGVFQLESQGMRKLLKNLIPTCLDDLTALNALYRPGPIKGGMLNEFCDRKHGRKQVRYPHPKLEDILKETYGIILYQEQIIQIAIQLAGYSHGSADELRKAIGKKKKSLMEKHRTVFIEGYKGEKEGDKDIPGTRKLGVDDKTALEIYSLIEKFGEYGFNKSHSAAYAVIAYQTAYLRSKYLPQYLCALMNNPVVKKGQGGGSRQTYIEDARRMGIDIKVPDVNRSGLNFEYFPPKKGEDSEKYPRGYILFGLEAVSNLSSMAAAEIVEERKKGEFKSLANFCERVDSRVTNKKMIEALIYSGAFDCFGVNRRELLFTSEDTRTHGQMTQKQRALGQVSIEDFLFEDDETETEAELPKSMGSKELQLNIADIKILLAEKKSLSDYISGHPLTIAHKFTNNFFPNTTDVRRSRLDENVRVLGVIADVDIKTTAKKQQKMAVFELEDNRGRVRCVIFPPRSPKKSDGSARQEDQYEGLEKYREFLDTEDIYLVEGKWSNSNDEERNIVVSAIHPFMNAIENNIPFIKIYLRDDAAKEEIETLHTLIRNHKGELPVILEIEKESHIISLNLNSAKIRPNYGFFEALDDARINYDLASRKPTGVSQESHVQADEEREEFEDTGYDEFEGEDDGDEE